MLCIFVLSILGFIVFSGQGSANTLDSSISVNNIGAMSISDSSDKTLLGMDLGTSDDISSVILTFKTSIEDETVNIFLNDDDNLEIGSGSKLVSPSSTIVTITLSNSITSIERSTLKTVSITIS